MRIGLIAMLRTGNNGLLRGEMRLAGRSVIAWQAGVLQSLCAERIICLAEDSANAELIGLQQRIEGQGLQFHHLRNFAALPALVRANDDLIVMLDGLVPDIAVVRAVLGSETGISRVVATIPADHPLARDFPQDFERVDAARHWGGILAMRGAGVQRLADFPEDSDATSLLLRLALQSGIPGHDLSAHALRAPDWQLAHDPDALVRHEETLMASAAPPPDWRTPGLTLASFIALTAMVRGFGSAGLAAGAIGMTLLLAGLVAAAAGYPAAGLGGAGLGVLAAQTAAAHNLITKRLYREAGRAGRSQAWGAAADSLAAATLWFALAPAGTWEPLAALGPLTVGLARIYAAIPDAAARPVARDRAALLLALTLAALLGWLPELLACLALGLVAALLLRAQRE